MLAAALLPVMGSYAVPARPGGVRVVQPDGSVFTLHLRGDEYMHFNTTSDGYSVVKDQRGYYVYAALKDGQLIPTAHVAHDVEERSAAEQNYVATLQRNLKPAMTDESLSRFNTERAAEARTRRNIQARAYDYTKMRGLVILVEFSDKSFSRSDINDLMDKMVNTENYTGYTDTKGNWVKMTGSVHDYYRDNSNGLFTPQFDVVGPVKINRSQYAMSNPYQAIIESVNAADSQVDFSLYDGDNNGVVDMVYFIFAGCGSHISGNDSRLLWPHASVVIDNWGRRTYKDGKQLDRYACSTEMTGSESNPTLDGIGTICHEFTHVMGLPDFYDTDYDGSGGEADHPGDFDVMASGSYLNDGKTPCGYTLYERYVMGFATPELIDKEHSYTLKSLEESNFGYRINSPSGKEFFLLENRQKVKWDKYVPCEGLAVYRVDSSNVSIWDRNIVNANPDHMYFQLLRAGGHVYNTTFPGRNRVTELSHATSPANLKTWSGGKTRIGLTNIQENGGLISFESFDTNILKSIELPESFVVGQGVERVLEPKLTPSFSVYTLAWSSDNPAVATVDQLGRVKGVAPGMANITVTSDNGVSATCSVTVEVQTVVADIKAFRQLADNEEAALMLQDAQVLFVNSNEFYLRDASGAIILKGGNLKTVAGTMLQGTVYGKRSSVNGMPQLIFVDSKSSAADVHDTGVQPVLPRKVKMSSLSSDDYCDLVCVEAVPLMKDAGIYAYSGDKRARLYNPFKIGDIVVPTDIDGKYFDVTAIYGTSTLKNKGVIEELKLLLSPVEVEAPNAIILVETDVATDAPAFNLRGQRVDDGYRGIVVRGGKIYVER